ncbi:MAG: hypothetical protein KQH83_11100 [Actinobacteria bacterium]|nr:hypothetical protein [Actinomycetota bacterium]
MSGLLPGLLLLAACGSGTAATTTTTVPAPTTTAAPTTTTTLPDDGALVSLAVGGDVEYAPSGEDLPPVGPSLLAADAGGGIHLYDPVGNRILSFTGDGYRTRSEIDLEAADILAVTAFTAASDHLLVVEVFFAPLRQRVHRVEYDGTVRETIDLPAGYGLEDGLSDVLAGDGDEIVIEYGGGAYYGAWVPESGSFLTGPALTFGGTTIVTRPPDLDIGPGTATADLAGSLGGMRYLGMTADGTVAVIREEVRVTSSVFDVLTTVEWYSPTGGFLGSARVPGLRSQAIGAPPGVAVLPDGRAVALVALPDVVQVVELPRVSVRITDLTSSA